MPFDGIEEHHARSLLWAVLEALPVGASLVFSRTNEDTRAIVLLRPGAYDIRSKAATWEESTRRMGRECAVNLAGRSRGD